MAQKSPLLSFLLSSLVVAWGTCPPAMRHAHDGGNESNHRHVVAVGQHEHGNPGPSERRQHEAGADASAAMGECAVHLHWVLLGMHFSLPASPDTHDSDQVDSFDPVVVRLIHDLPTISRVEQRCVTAEFPVSEELIGSAVCLVPAPLSRPNPIASLPLCDRARFERSGVLLA